MPDVAPTDPRNNQPDAEPEMPSTTTLTTHTAASLTELLNLCEEFLRTASPHVLAELRTYLDRQRPPADPTWLIDMLGFSSAHLRHLLPTSTDSPSHSWHPAP
jgi:hypothetical protein